MQVTAITATTVRQLPELQLPMRLRKLAEARGNFIHSPYSTGFQVESTFKKFLLSLAPSVLGELPKYARAKVRVYDTTRTKLDEVAYTDFLLQVCIGDACRHLAIDVTARWSKSLDYGLVVEDIGGRKITYNFPHLTLYIPGGGSAAAKAIHAEAARAAWYAVATYGLGVRKGEPRWHLPCAGVRAVARYLDTVETWLGGLPPLSGRMATLRNMQCG